MFPFQGSATNTAFSTTYSGHAHFAFLHHDNSCNVRLVPFLQNLDPVLLAPVSVYYSLVTYDHLAININFHLRESFSFAV